MNDSRVNRQARRSGEPAGADRHAGFLRAKEAAQKRHQRRRARMLVHVGLVAVSVIFGIGLAAIWFRPWEPAPGLPALAPLAPVPDPQFAGQPATARPAARPAAPDEPGMLTTGFIDLPGDPLWIEHRLDGGGTAALQRRPRPGELAPDRGSGAVILGREALLRPGERLVVSLPSSQEDFAVFQAQRRARPTQPAFPQDPVSPGHVQSDPPQPADAAAARALQSVLSQQGGAGRVAFASLFLQPSGLRTRLYTDAVVRVRTAASLSEVLRLEGVDAPRAAEAESAAAALLGLNNLEAGMAVALRKLTGTDAAGSGDFAQLALYRGGQFLGALALAEEAPTLTSPTLTSPTLHSPTLSSPTLAASAAVPTVEAQILEGSDPWVARDLPALIDGDTLPDVPAGPPPRILDALYAAILRMDLSPELVGEIMTLLSEGQRLEAEARAGDSVTLLFSETADALEHVLYIGVQAEGAQVQCHVFAPSPGQAHACYGNRSAGSQVVEGARADIGADAAVEALVNRIIQIESAGRIDARNPLSTATGPGQFLDSTWLRMMRIYRPDLTARYSRQELLNLRVTDYDLSREMVLNLAREGERHLRARGHDITPGRLYLAHFLGMEGAHIALSAPRETPLSSLYSAAVINANPHLRGQTAGFVVDWAETLMQRGGRGRVAVIREPQGLGAFRSMVESLLQPA
ncbi:MAG: hypothetical protein ACK4GT_02530 [Pararhodobacter sp.]